MIMDAPSAELGSLRDPAALCGLLERAVPAEMFLSERHIIGGGADATSDTDTDEEGSGPMDDSGDGGDETAETGVGGDAEQGPREQSSSSTTSPPQAAGVTVRTTYLDSELRIVEISGVRVGPAGAAGSDGDASMWVVRNIFVRRP